MSTPVDRGHASLFDSAALSRSLFFPRGDASPPPADARDLFVDVEGARLHVRLHGDARARRVVLLFHGNGEVVADWDSAAPEIAAMSAAFAVADYRGYGQSTGAPSLRAIIRDAPRVLDAVVAATRLPVVVMGRSLGSMCAHELHANAPPGLAGVILESGIEDLRAFVRRRGLEPPAVFTPVELATFDPPTKLARGTLPLLVVHGARDEIISASEARIAFAAATTADKQLVLVPDRGHNDIVGAPAWRGAIARFVARFG